MQKSDTGKSVIILFVVIAVYSVLCLTKHQYVRITADSMLYFSLAEKYLSGDFANAINGYWGPLLSWLLIPFMYFGISDVVAINMLNLIVGILMILGIWVLSQRFEMTDRIRSLLLICALPIVLKFSIVQPMDFILVCILVFYLSIVFKDDYPDKISSGVFSGILGSAAYLTKAYAFPFFIVHFFIMNVFHYLKNGVEESRKKILRNAIAGFVLFALISGAWIMTISDKYGHFTFSTMRETNFNAPGPDVVGGGLEFGVPVFKEGFFEPPNETAFVIWEDPSYLRGEQWSAWQSMRHFKHFIKLTAKNTAEGLLIFEGFSTFSIMILIAYLLLLSTKPLKELVSNSLLYPLFTLVLFSGGYLLFHFEERYVWLVNILLLLMGGHVLNVLFQNKFFKYTTRKNILIVFFVISFIFTPVRFIMQTSNGSIDKFMHDISVDLQQYNISGNIASNRYSFSHDAWHETFRLAYWLNCRYYGQSREGISDEDLEKELDKYNIDYYFVWGEEPHLPEFLIAAPEVTGNNIPGLKVYFMKSARISSALEGDQQ